jgi:VIT1/CCC1 family predicted Fe2+/Mn2+ transporter
LVQDNRYVIAACVIVALAVIGLTGYLVADLSSTSPAVIAAVLAAFAGVLAALPPIIKAIRGR